MIKAAAFMPHKTDNETSVFRHTNLTKSELQSLIIKQGVPAERWKHGYAMVLTSAVRAARLSVLAVEPPKAHAVIQGWPSHHVDPAMKKAEQLGYAQTIALAATSVEWD